VISSSANSQPIEQAHKGLLQGHQATLHTDNGCDRPKLANTPGKGNSRVTNYSYILQNLTAKAVPLSEGITAIIPLQR